MHLMPAHLPGLRLRPCLTHTPTFAPRPPSPGASKGFYTYAAFLAAAAAFPGFGTSAQDPAVNQRELAAFLGQISHETTGGWATAPDGPYSWGLCWITEGGCTPCGVGCWGRVSLSGLCLRQWHAGGGSQG